METNEPFGADPFAEDLDSIRRQDGDDDTDAKRPAPRHLVERAVSLFEADSGWHYRPADGCDALFFVHHRRQGACHIVFLASERYDAACTCEIFAAEGTCVHLLAVEHEMYCLARIEEQERLHGYAEHPRFGTDPDTRY